MKQYQELQKAILSKGTRKEAAREGMPGTISLFGYQSRYDLQKGFPILTTKEVDFKNIVAELIWFLQGDTNVKTLIEQGCNIWNEDAYNYYIKLCKAEGIEKVYTLKEFEKTLNNQGGRILKLPKGYILGDCGKQYGWLWRKLEGFPKLIAGNEVDEWTHVDQLYELIKGLIDNPLGRRHIIDAWNPSTLDEMALHPCHVLVQFNCRPLTTEEIEAFIPEGTPEYIFSGIFNAMPKYYLDCHMYQRSADTFLGVPYNISSYSLLTILLSNLLNMVPGEFIHSFGDAHIYENHISQTNIQLQREPKPLPKLEWSEEMTNVINELRVSNFDSEMKTLAIIEVLETMEIEDVKLKGYYPHPKIAGKLSTGLK